MLLNIVVKGLRNKCIWVVFVVVELVVFFVGIGIYL